MINVLILCTGNSCRSQMAEGFARAYGNDVMTWESAGLSPAMAIPKETVENCIRYVKQSQNPDGGFRYMLQGGASSFPRSAAGVVALFSAAVGRAS